MNKKLLLILVPVVILASVFGYWKWKTRDYSDPLLAERKARTERSIKIINQGLKEGPSALYQAMISIAQQVEPETLQKIQSFASSEEKLIRAAVTFVMVYQKDEKSKEILQKMINDPEPLVRSHVSHAARQQPGEDKIEIMKDLLKNKNLTEVESIQAKGTLYRCLQDKAEASRVLDSLISDVHFDSKSRITDLIMLELNAIAPDHKRVAALNQKALTLSKNPAVLSAAIRSLAAEKDPAVVANFSKWIHSTEISIKRAAIETIHEICPSKRWEWISEGYAQDQDFALRSLWILAAERLRGKEAEQFLSSALENATKAKNATEVRALESAISRLHKINLPEPCAKKN